MGAEKGVDVPDHGRQYRTNGPPAEGTKAEGSGRFRPGEGARPQGVRGPEPRSASRPPRTAKGAGGRGGRRPLPPDDEESSDGLL